MLRVFSSVGECMISQILKDIANVRFGGCGYLIVLSSRF